MAPCNGTTSIPPKLAVTLPANHSTLQWHPTKAPSNGTTSSAPCHGTLVQSAKVVRRPPPLLEVRTPIAIAIWGKIITSLDVLAQLILFCLAPCFAKTKEESNTNIWSTAGITHQSRSCFWNPYDMICKSFFFVHKFRPRFESTLQIKGTLQAWDWKLDGLDIGKLPKWRSFRALPIRFARQHRQNSPELTLASRLGDERRRLRLGNKYRSKKHTQLDPKKWKSSPSH